MHENFIPLEFKNAFWFFSNKAFRRLQSEFNSGGRSQMHCWISFDGVACIANVTNLFCQRKTTPRRYF
jgi:hypothetical protein